MNAPINPACLTTLQETIFSTPGVGPAPSQLQPDDHVDYRKIPAKDLSPIDQDILNEELAAPRINAAEILGAMALTNHTSKEVSLSEWQGYLAKHNWPEGHEGKTKKGDQVRVYNTEEGYGVLMRGAPSRYFVSTFVKRG